MPPGIPPSDGVGIPTFSAGVREWEPNWSIFRTPSTMRPPEGVAGLLDEGVDTAASPGMLAD
eukprot:982937-Prorocentrum_minimum.AAC.1